MSLFTRDEPMRFFLWDDMCTNNLCNEDYLGGKRKELGNNVFSFTSISLTCSEQCVC